MCQSYRHRRELAETYPAPLRYLAAWTDVRRTATGRGLDVCDLLVPRDDPRDVQRDLLAFGSAIWRVGHCPTT